ncbi:30S ribosomal protein S16 [Demequina aurantiaca]|uniref:30S ribosomal protein S16 n=1 Tax=Demequina aurantiaca TaxID=676200 RepID=UPI003D354D93
MAVKIRLKRFGKKKAPFYRVVVMDGRAKRDGKALEEIGIYHPLNNPSIIQINSERALYWLSVGAQPSGQVFKLLTLTGDMGIHKGDKDAKSTVQVAGEKVSAEDQIQAHADAAEKLKAAKAVETEKAKKAAEDEAKAAEEAAKAEAKAAEDAAKAEAKAAAAEAPAEEAPAADEAPAAEEAPAADAEKAEEK